MIPRRTRLPLAFAAGLAASMAAMLGLTGCDQLFPHRSEGEKLYRKHCADCHGVDARGNTPRYMGNAYADLRDDTWRTAAADEGSLQNLIEAGVFGEMPAFTDQLSGEEIRQIVYYLKVLRGERAPESPPK
ncbi:MAG TPA: cytochrome c [Thermoanaerobaculia bacterium]|nr:cytochrome c [Thermoanaerobaculia bacterium]